MTIPNIKEFALRAEPVGSGYIVAMESKSTVNRVVCYLTEDFTVLVKPRYFEDEVAANEHIDKLIKKSA